MPPRQQPQGPVYLDEHHQRISEFADEYFEDDEERDAFVGELMTRRGYTSRTRTEWEHPAPEPEPKAGAAEPAPKSQKPAYLRR